MSIISFITGLFGGGKEPEMTMTQVFAIPSLFENVRTIEGGCTDGTYVYETIIDPNAEDGSVPGRILKISIAENKAVGISEELSIDHANDITYNSKTRELIVCNNKPNYTTLTFVDPDSLQVKYTKQITSAVYSLVYVGASDFYYAGISRTFNVVELDADFNVKGSFNMIDNGYTRQTLDTDGEYIYAVYYKQNCIYKYDVNGTFLGRCDLPVTDNEAENIFFLNGDMYVSYNVLKADSPNCGIIYRLDNPKFVK